MDSITQATLGAAMGELVLGKKIGNRGLLWGLLFGTLPDLDVIANPFLSNAARLEFHRGASHSLLIMVLASLFLARPLSKLWKKEKVSATRAGFFVFLAWLTHVLIDCFTVYGTSVLWPFTSDRIAFNNLFIIDFFFTLPLIVACIWLAFYRTKKTQKKRTRILTYGLLLSSMYVGLSFCAKAIVSSIFENDLENRNVQYTRKMEAPTLFNILLWRAVVQREGEFWVGYRSLLDAPSKPIRWTVYPQGKEALASFKDSSEIETLKWFSRGWWIARRHVDGVWIADLRFGEARIYDAKPNTVDSRFVFSWSYQSDNEGEKIVTNRPEMDSVSNALKKLGWRIIGNQKAWESAPRLSGVKGSLPVPLQVVE